MPRPPVKATYRLAYAKALGETYGHLAGEYKWKQSKKGLKSSLRDHIGRMIDRIDPLELTAAFFLTPTIRGVIITSNDLLKKASVLGKMFTLAPMVDLWKAYNVPLGHPEQLLPIIMEYVEPFLPAPAQAAPKLQDELFLWGLSFSISLLLIRHGGQIFGLLDKGLTAIVGMLMGV